MMDKEKPSSVSKDAMLTVGANLLGIVLIIKHEHVNVITSKALGLVIRTSNVNLKRVKDMEGLKRGLSYFVFAFSTWILIFPS